MRLTPSRLIIAGYIMVCFSISLLNYRYNNNEKNSIMNTNELSTAPDVVEKLKTVEVGLKSGPRAGLKPSIEFEIKSNGASRLLLVKHDSTKDGNREQENSDIRPAGINRPEPKKLTIKIVDLPTQLLEETSVRYSEQKDGVQNVYTPEGPTQPIWPEESNSSDRILEQINILPTGSPNNLKIFLPQGVTTWSIPPGSAIFKEEKCGVQNCFVTSQEKDQPHSSAVIFRQQLSPILKGSPRPVDQLWILYILESPENTPMYPAGEYAGVNYTATYRRDSDIVTPYGKWVPYPPDVSAHLRTFPSPQMAPRNYALGKDRFVAWFVSNCFTANNRRVYAKELAGHIPVDIYGTCGELKCSRYEPAKCGLMLARRYKFYLSFENSNCVDYITEKFFDIALKHDIIPVVMGARREDYDRVAPPGSFIHVEDFDGPKELAQYLHYLDKNETAYNGYFQWKSMGSFINTKFWCRVCALINRPIKKQYSDMDAWWRRPGICRKGAWNDTSEADSRVFKSYPETMVLPKHRRLLFPGK